MWYSGLRVAELSPVSLAGALPAFTTCVIIGKSLGKPWPPPLLSGTGLNQLFPM